MSNTPYNCKQSTWIGDYVNEKIDHIDEGMQRREHVLEEMLRGFAREHDIELKYRWSSNMLMCWFAKGDKQASISMQVCKSDNLYTTFMYIKTDAEKRLGLSEDEKLHRCIISNIKLPEAALRNSMDAFWARYGSLPRTDYKYAFHASKNVSGIKKVIFNDPATIVLWADGTKTVVKCQENDIYDPEKGLAMAITKKALGNEGNYCNELKKWIPQEEEEILPTLDINDGLKRASTSLRNLARSLRRASKDSLVEKAYHCFNEGDFDDGMGYLGEYLND